MDTFVEDLKKKSNIEINEANLAKVVVEAGPAMPGPALGAGLPGAPTASAGAPPAGTPAAAPLHVQRAGGPAAPTHP